MCGVQRYNLKQTLIGCPCCPYCKTSVHDSKRDYFQKRDISGGVNPHTLHTKIFIKEIRSKIPKKHKLSCHTRLVLLTPGLCVGVNPHTLHTKKFIKEIQSKILKKHKLSCHTGLILLTPGLCVGVNPHTLHTKKCIKEIQSKILKKHKLCCHTGVILLMPQLCTYDDRVFSLS